MAHKRQKAPGSPPGGLLLWAIPGDIPDQLVQRFCEWAAAHGQFQELWLFGSRAKGTHRSDSDIDLAIVFVDDSEAALGNYIALADGWQWELRKIANHKVSLEGIIPGTAGWAEVTTTGVRLWTKGSDDSMTYRARTDVLPPGGFYDAQMHEGAKEIARTLAGWADGQPITVYLYGSRVRGDHKPESDVDIFVTFDDPTNALVAWWTCQNAEDFATIKALLPGPLKILEPNDPIGQLVAAGPVVHRDRNIVCVLRPSHRRSSPGADSPAN